MSTLPDVADQIQIPEQGGAVFTADATELLDTLPDASVDLFLSDPPFSRETHAGARTNRGGRPNNRIRFSSFTYTDLKGHLERAARVVRAWAVVHTDWRWMAQLAEETPPGLKFVRAGAWAKIAGAPQITGDRPAQGWEAIAILHADRPGRMRWNGGGLPAVWNCLVTKGRKGERETHETEKPLALEAQLVREFSNPGDLVIDPFCGSGTAVLAAAQLGRRAIGCDLDRSWIKVAYVRIALHGGAPPPAPLRRSPKGLW